ncbi:Phosphoserine phosphatase RsbU [Maioricimonas rarisocia]|uniref:Phosphoserine phosphatase RsbU n=1 Tax=Maioricimonas rarisocia TaxID=2528026 RepID=A0A517ZE72_9PLAN|nr:SpoIIE family protein phosphatase [Maioricimonas rarisocia]QDU40783.1 Phosphoserine phosphatase RsbU [Maioricimonas rarisocia]
MSTTAKFPKSIVWTVVVVCALPPVLNLLGVNFGTVDVPLSPETYFQLEGDAQRAALYAALRGAFVHTILEWTAFCVAALTVVVAFMHYFLSRNIITPIVGTALFFSGMLDAFHVLAADMLTESNVHLEAFIPYSWTVSRTFNALIVVAGTTPFLWRGDSEPIEPPRHGLTFLLVAGLLCGVAAYAINHVCATAEQLPQFVSVLPHIVRRPFDLIPLALYLFAAGIVLPRLYKQHRSLFARGLHVSVLPHLVSQLYAVNSEHLFDNASNVASGLKIVGYIVPLAGLLVDYRRAYHSEAALQGAHEQLRMARVIQQSLLPKSPPVVEGVDVAGTSQFAETVGGDYYDHLLLADGTLWLVVADVSGHDVGSSLLMANTRAYLRSMTQTGSDLESIIRRLNQFLCDDADGRRFVTFWCGRLDPEQRELTYIGAGHPGHVLRSDGRLEELSLTGAALGIDSDGEFRPRLGPVVSLEAGDTLLLLTDGLLEASGPDGEQFGIERAAAIVARCSDRTAAESIAELLDEVEKFCAPEPFTDDVTAVIARMTGRESQT